LGLAIVKRLGEILDHRVEVRSTPGKGTRFFIEVPRGRSGVKVPEAARRCILKIMPSSSTGVGIPSDPSYNSV
jgi:hypothetical protein